MPRVKKIINDPGSIVTEVIDGLVLTSAGKAKTTGERAPGHDEP